MSETGLNRPDVIKVVVTQSAEMQADRADLYVSIRGSSFVTGNAATQKAREVRQLVSELKEYGVQENDIHLQGVQADLKSGMLTKSSAATYTLKIHCANMDFLTEILGIVTAQKNITLHALEWGYRDEAGLRERLLVDLIERANQKANLIAAGLGVKLLGVHHFAEEFHDMNRNRYMILQEVTGDYFAKTRVSTRTDLGFEITHLNHISLSVTIEYRVSDLEVSL